MTPEEQASEFVKRVLWNLLPVLQDNARVEIAAMLHDAKREAYAEAKAVCVCEMCATAIEALGK